jgi:hypothetical protein
MMQERWNGLKRATPAGQVYSWDASIYYPVGYQSAVTADDRSLHMDVVYVGTQYLLVPFRDHRSNTSSSWDASIYYPVDRLPKRRDRRWP